MSSDQNKAVLYSSLLALQFGLQPLISTRFTSLAVSRPSIVIGTELGKILIAVLSIAFESSATKQTIRATWTLKDSLYYAAVPAVLYAIQNVLVQIGYTLVDSMTFNLLNQTKTLSAAFWLYVMLGKKQSPVQIFALFLLLAAAVTLNMGSKAAVSVDVGQYKIGVMVVLAASVLSGISAAFVEKAFVAIKQRNALLFSAELALYGIIFLLSKEVLFGGSVTNTLSSKLFASWTPLTLIPVMTNACGGLIVGLVSKYGGSIMKGFAMIAGLLVTAVAQWIIEKKPLGPEHWIAAALVSASIYLHTSFPPKKKVD